MNLMPFAAPLAEVHPLFGAQSLLASASMHPNGSEKSNSRPSVGSDTFLRLRPRTDTQVDGCTNVLPGMGIDTRETDWRRRRRRTEKICGPRHRWARPCPHPDGPVSRVELWGKGADTTTKGGASQVLGEIKKKCLWDCSSCAPPQKTHRCGWCTVFCYWSLRTHTHTHTLGTARQERSKKSG